MLSIAFYILLSPVGISSGVILYLVFSFYCSVSVALVVSCFCLQNESDKAETDSVRMIELLKFLRKDNEPTWHGHDPQRCR